MRCGFSSPEGPEIDVTVTFIKKLQQVMWVSGVMQHIDFQKKPLNCIKFWLGNENKAKGHSFILKFYMRNTQGIMETYEVVFGKNGLQKDYY